MNEFETSTGPEVAETVLFDYSPENPPPLDILRTKMFAVHSTSILPINGLMKAGARNIGYRAKWYDEPPSFRPTIHFALGEMVPDHGDWSWDDNSYAVVTPLSEIEDRLVNVFTHDSFILGNLELSPGMTLVVPKGTDTSSITHTQIKEYSENRKLRDVVDEVIEERGGWHIRMKPQTVSIGSEGAIEGIEINEPEFFQNLFIERPYISFGTHAESQRGDGFRFGYIDQVLNSLMKSYGEYGPVISTDFVAISRALIVHNLERLNESLRGAELEPRALEVFEKKSGQVREWLHIVDCDLKLRRQFGKSLNRFSSQDYEKAKSLRNDPTALEDWTIENRGRFNSSTYDETDISSLSHVLASFDFNELKEFITNTPEFSKYDLAELMIKYAASRWIVIKTKKAREEGIDQLLARSLAAKSTSKEDRIIDQFTWQIQHFLSEDSKRLETALEIYREPYVREYLTDTAAYIFENTGPDTLEDLLRANPTTGVLFERTYYLSEAEKQNYDVLKSLGREYQLLADPAQKPDSFVQAFSESVNIEHSRRSLTEDLKCIHRPMSSKRRMEEITVGDLLSLYEQMFRDDKPSEMWARADLAEEYRKMFPSDADFWNSKKSLLQIYEQLIEKKSIKTSPKAG